MTNVKCRIENEKREGRFRFEESHPLAGARLLSVAAAMLGGFIETALPATAAVTYTPLEYIESRGTQYINTKVVPAADTAAKIDLQVTTLQDKAYIFGSYTYGTDPATLRTCRRRTAASEVIATTTGARCATIRYSRRRIAVPADRSVRRAAVPSFSRRPGK